jgi:hypothetical protein
MTLLLGRLDALDVELSIRGILRVSSRTVSNPACACPRVRSRRQSELTTRLALRSVRRGGTYGVLFRFSLWRQRRAMLVLWPETFLSEGNASSG